MSQRTSMAFNPEHDIDFACVACGVMLEMPGEAVGEEVDCPDCGVVLVVPSPAVVPEPGGRRRLPSEQQAEWSSADIPVDASPIAPASVGTSVCVICGTRTDTGLSDGVTCGGCGTPLAIDFRNRRKMPRGIFVGEILATATRLFFGRLGVLIPAVVVETMIAILLYVVLDSVFFLGQNSPLIAVFGLAGLYAIYHALHVGHFRMMFAVARGEDVDALRLIWPESGRAYVWPAVQMVVMYSLFWLATGFGMLFGILPGLVFALLAWPCGRVLLDRDVTAGQAISQSIDLTLPHWPGVLSLTSLLFALQLTIGLLAVTIGELLTALIVLAVVVPYSSLVLTVTYFRLSDEPTAIDLATRST